MQDMIGFGFNFGKLIFLIVKEIYMPLKKSSFKGTSTRLGSQSRPASMP